jgi:DNA-binding beta-propeller fold protein YncE
MPAASLAAEAGFAGAWEGDLVDPSGKFPIRIVLDGCTTNEAVCGELEYGDPGGADQVFCASELTRTRVEGEVLALRERLVYRPWMCFESALEVRSTADGGLEIEQLGGDGEVCCRGTLADIGETLPTAPAADLGEVAGLGRTTATTALGGATTQYPAVAEGSVWFPLEDRGQVARVDAASGEIRALIDIGDPSAVQDLPSDPHGVAAGDAGIWVTNAAERSVGRIDPATNTVAESIPVQVVPYALALDGGTLWVTSYLDDRVVRIDLETGEIVGDISVPKPTGIAIGFDAVWVVEHRDDKIARIDPDTNEVVEEIVLGERGPNDLCGMCVENVVVGDDAVWTANNEGRSVSRIDPDSNKVTATIDLPLRAWAVSPGGGSIWASQFEDAPNGGFGDLSGWAVARIDQATGEATSYPVPAFSVSWGADALWTVIPGRRGDSIVRLELDD